MNKEELDTIQNELTQTGPIRHGFEYQDACAAHLFVNWLKQPDYYKWAKLEADEFDSLDDIAILDKKKNLWLKQIKFSCHSDAPSEEWTWDFLLREAKGKRGSKSSLFKKWFFSWLNTKKNKLYSNVFAELVTNRKAGNDIIDSTDFCKDGKGRYVNFSKFKKNHKQHFEKALKQIYPTSENELNNFFESFRFLFDEPELETIWNAAERIFIEFGGLVDDWGNFKDKIRRWATIRNEPSIGGKITIEDLRNSAGWARLRSFNEKFQVPNDFVLFDDRVSQSIIYNIKKISGGVQILWGSPGAGKSTYLSYLNNKLEELKFCVLKHHYYIGLNDPDFTERLKSERTKEAFKFEILRKFRRELGELSSKNPKIASLREYLQILSNYFTTHKKTLTLIIDGLDHVTTYSDKKELKEFLEEIFPCPTGIWVILGTRLIEENVFPPCIFQSCPKRDWIEIKAFTKRGVNAIISKNIKKLNLPDNRYIRKDFAEKFFQITQGHPLHIRYTIEKLIDLSTKQTLTAKDVENLPPYAGNIENYYATLWRNLPTEGKNIVILMATADFTLTQEQILGVLNLPPTTMQLLLDGFNQIKHLIKTTLKGLIFFHASFKTYILATEECKSAQHTVKTFLKDWLEKKAPENIRWENLLKIEYELDNHVPLLNSLSKEWAMEAIKELRSFSKIDEQLELGIDAALKKDDFATALFFGLLSLKINNALLDNQDNYEKLFLLLLGMKEKQELSLFLNEDSIPYISSKRLSAILELTYKKNRDDIIKNIFDELNMHINRDDNSVQRFLPRENALYKAAAYARIGTQAILKDLSGFKDANERTMLLLSYCGGLLETKQFTTIESLFQEKLSQGEKENVLDSYSYYCLVQKMDCTRLILRQKNKVRGKNAWLLLMLTGKLSKKSPLNLPTYAEFPDELEDYKTDERTAIKWKFYNCYLSALFLGFNNEGANVEKWIGDCSLNSWSIKACLSLANLGKNHGEKIAKKEALNYESLILEANKLEVLKWPENRDTYQIFIAFKEALVEIFDLMKIINFWLKGLHKIEESVLKDYCNSEFFGKYSVIKNLAYEKSPLLDKAICIKLIEKEEKEIKKTISHFSERAESYLDLSHLAMIHSENDIMNRLIRKAIINLLGYGYHKDLYHSDVLDSIVTCNKAGSSKCNAWLERISPLIAEVRNYTDGDETRYLPEYLAEAYASVNPQRLKNYYLYNANEENLFLAEDIFPYIIETNCIDSPFEKALLKTGIDKESILKLEKLAKENNHIAETVLKEQEQYFLNLESFPRRRDYGVGTSGIGPEKPIFDYDSIIPGQLITKLDKLENKYEKDKFLISWCLHWFSKPDKQEESYRIACQWVELTGIEDADYKILDLLYPLAAKFDGKDKSYYLLYHAHLRGYGWSGRFFSHEEDVLRRWHYLKSNYPEKARDFLKDTLMGVDKQGSKRFTGFLTIPRGIEYLTYFGFLNEAESMTEVAVKFAESLMADLELPKPSWINEALVNSLDILFSRLVWPSPIVRERAATALCVLLSDKLVSSEVLKKLLEWNAKSSLESITTIALLPIAKSARHDGKNSVLEYDLIKNAVIKPTINSEFILKEIAKSLDEELLTKEQFEETKEPLNLLVCPTDYEPSKFFLRSVSGFLPSVNFERAKKIEKISGFEFIKQWAWDANRIQKDLKVAENFGEAMEFMGGQQYHPIMSGMSTKLSEIYRTAFMRTLFLSYKLKKIPKEILLKWTFSLCPIDLTFWDIDYQSPPNWWPQLMKQVDTEIDISKSRIWESLDNLISLSIRQNKILALNGPARPFEGWLEKDLDTTITLIPFAYKVKGGNLPSFHEIIKELQYYPIHQLSTDAKNPLCFFDSEGEYFDKEVIGGFSLKDLGVFPLVSRLDTLTINLWQICRECHLPFGLSENLLSLNLKLLHRYNEWSYTHNEKEIAKGYTWNFSITERHENEFDIPSGQVLEINENWLKEILESQQVRLAHLVNIKMVLRKTRYDKPNTYEETKIFGISPIIV